MKKTYYLFSLALAAVTFSSLAIPSTAHALSGSEWSAGRIIDDGVFTDSSSMSVQEIQRFLNSKMPNCDTYGTGSVNGTTRAAYADSKGNPKPSGRQIFTCLKDYYEVPKTVPGPESPASNYGYGPGSPPPAGSRSAAQLILDAAQATRISPKVLLVTLQKEQSLLTDTWPFHNQYRYAMGAHCPDGPNGAECDPNYAGFSLQILEGAKLLRGYLDGMTKPWWPYKKPYTNNNILWNVTHTNCGGSNVYIESMATAALYTYTPYQPNKAALDNLYGQGDGCSAYGNRNFWRMFNDWFGTSKGDLFNASLVYQSASPDVLPGQNVPVTLKYRNSGQWSWHDTAHDWPGIPPMILAASSGPSMFSWGWPTSNVPATTFSKVYETDGTTLAANQHLAHPGQIVQFDFNVTTPWAAGPGAHDIRFKPVLAGTLINLGELSETTMRVNIPPLFSARLLEQSVYPAMTPGENKPIRLKYRNAGQWTWRDEAHDWPGLPAFYIKSTQPSMFSWGWADNATPLRQFSRVYEANGTTLAANQHLALPGQIVQFDFNVTAPWTAGPGQYFVDFKPVMGGIDFGNESVSRMGINIPMWRAANAGQSVYPTISRGQSQTVFLRYKNTGAYTWHDDSISWPGIPDLQLTTLSGGSPFSYSWPDRHLAGTRFYRVYQPDGVTLAANQQLVHTNQIVEFRFNLTTPWDTAAGTYPQFFKPSLGNFSIDTTDAVSRLDVHVP